MPNENLKRSGFTFKRSANSGFTLIELLLVVTILSLLAVAVFAALNPLQRIKDSRNARRTSDVDTILTAIHESIVDNKGTLPTAIASVGTTTKQLGTSTTTCSVATASGCYVPQNTDCADFTAGAQNLNKYLKSIPIDPAGGTYTAAITGYTVQVDANGIVTVGSCGAMADGGSISISR
jgi:prepilin-type N-terminal cleavage/methylation domain-containing protein